MCSRILGLPEFLDSRHMKAVNLSAVHTVTFILMTPRHSLVLEAVYPQDHRAAGKNKSISITNKKTEFELA